LPYHRVHVDDLPDTIRRLEADGHEVVDVEYIHGSLDHVHLITKRPMSVELTTREGRYGVKGGTG
jgi:hypothetical protein